MPNKILQKQRNTIDKRFISLIAAFAYFLLSSCVAYAIDTTKITKDTLRFTAPPVIVTGESYVEHNKFIPFFSSKIFANKDIEKIPAIQISDIINKSPGVYIKNYGGTGGLKTVNIRGTNSSQNVILMDGVPLNSKQNSMFDLSILPLSFIHNIEILRGGASDMFGSNAMGGGINLQTSEAPYKSYKIQYNFGSYNEHNLSLDFPALVFGKLRASLAGGAIYSGGDYKFKFNEYGEDKILRRENAEFQNYGLLLNTDYLLPDYDNYLNFKSIVTYTTRGVPGSVVQNRIESKYAQIKEVSGFNNLSYRAKISEDNNIKIHFIGKYNKQNYDDEQPNAIETLKNAQFINTELGLIINNNYDNTAGDFKVKSNVEYFYCNLNGDMLDKNVGREVSRNNFSVSTIVSKAFKITDRNYISIAPSARIDLYSKYTPAYSYAAGAYYYSILNKEKECILDAKFRYSRNFRVPSFNELYYYNYGTADLKPERAHSFDLSAGISLFNLWKLEVSGYYINTADQIVSVPKNTISWSAVNLGKVETKGLEVLLTGKIWNDKIEASLSYTLQAVKDKSENSLNFDKYIIYTPQEIINSTVNLNCEPLMLQLNCEYSSHRFALPDNSYQSILPNYFILNSAIFYRIEINNNMNLRLQLELNNILDKNYQMILNYPMPGRIFRIGANIEILPNTVAGSSLLPSGSRK